MLLASQLGPFTKTVDVTDIGRVCDQHDSLPRIQCLQAVGGHPVIEYQVE